MKADKPLGYTLVGRRFEPFYKPSKGSVVTRAFIMCCMCRLSIHHSDGPRTDVYCPLCYEIFKDDIEDVLTE